MRKPRAPGTVDRGHVIRLDPTVKQANALARAAGVSRFTYNWGLEQWSTQYAAGGKPTASKLKLQFNAIKQEQYPWVMESPRDASSQPFADLRQAFTNFFKSCRGERKGRKIGYPQRRKRGKDDSFYVANDKFKVQARGKKRGAVRLPVIGTVRMFEKLRWSGKILSGRVYKEAEQWFLSIAVETKVVTPLTFENVIVGVDLGLKTAVVPSHGDPIDSPKPLKKALKCLRRANKKLHRRERGGRNRSKARILVAKIHRRVANVRKDFLHKITTRLARENQTVVIEDLNVAGMLQNEKWARAVSDVGMGTFRVLCGYKAAGRVILADRWFPSSKLCSSCGNKKEDLPLSERVYRCDVCGLVIDRDLNAALNLEQYPGLLGNWGRKVRKPVDIEALADPRIGETSVDEAGTRSEDSLVLTN